MTNKELYAHAVGYYYGRTVGVYDNLFDGEPEAHWFKRGYDTGVADYCEMEAEVEEFVFNPRTTKTEFVAPVSLKRANDLLIRRGEMDKLIEMLNGAYFALVDGGDTHVDVDKLIGCLGEFIALWEGDEGAFSSDEDKTPALVALVNKLKGVEDAEAEVEKFILLKKAGDLLKGDE